MPSFRLNLRTSDTKKNGEIPIYIIVTDTRPYYINLKISCRKWEWDFDQNRPKDFVLDAFCQEKLLLVRKEYLTNGFDIDKFKEVIRPREIRDSFLAFAQEVIEQERKRSLGNSQVYHTAVVSFRKFMGGGDVLFSDVNEKKIMDYRSWMTSEKISVNSQNLYLRTLRAIWKKRSDHHPFNGLLPKTIKTQKRALREDDITKLLEHTSDHAPTLRSLDMFRLMFYLCGINYLDLFHADKDQVQGDYFIFQRKKLGGRGDETKIWLSERAKYFIKKYAGKEKLLNISENITTKASYKTHLKRTNMYLTKVGKELGIGRITTNVARHSFATIARNRGVPLDIIKLLLSHSDNTITGVYLGEYPENVLIDNIKKATYL